MRLDLNAVRTFQDGLLPDETRLAGWAALVQALSIQAPVRRPSCVSEKHVRGSQREEGVWRIFDKRYWPGEDFTDHLTFALRHEDLNLLILKRAFDAVPAKALQELIAAAPTGIPSRRIWFLYEWLTGRTLACLTRRTSQQSMSSTLKPTSRPSRAFPGATAYATICSA